MYIIGTRMTEIIFGVEGICFFFLFYAPERTSDGILKSHRPSVTIRVSVIIKKTDKGNLLKRYRKIK